ncbi:MAG: SDR family NAD(P)-dependent oxidoreductase [Chrysiogenetes bacterium]|nr:SDR family NAD(P)-dependent oxidoreductase [Chrysiogenetes bacterium]
MGEGKQGTIPPDGRVVMISGANRGIGLSIARRLHADGYRLSLGARDPAKLAAAVADLGGDVLQCRYDAEDRPTAAAWVEETASHFGQIDALVNNAGVLRAYPFDQPDEDQLDEMWAVNVKGPYFLSLAALPHLRATGQGRIVNILSNSGLRYAGGVPGYAMSKFSAVALTHVLRYGTWEDGVRVCGLCPGAVDTDMSRTNAPFPGEKIDPDTVAAIVSLVISLPNSASIATMPINYALESVV